MVFSMFEAFKSARIFCACIQNLKTTKFAFSSQIWYTESKEKTGDEEGFS